jgi:phage baseplate assembly protein W|tara:strand:+ start:88 stop:489 length:402 start_codon:yes stop_codon:yes gene_type:complete
MPVQGISKSFKDISATFSINPMNGDLIALKNANAIARSVRNLVLTKPGERPFNPALGSNVHNLLFEPVDRITAAAIKSEIRDTILNFEPRVKLQDVNVSPTSDGLGYNITIQFSVIGINVPPQELSLSLESTR